MKAPGSQYPRAIPGHELQRLLAALYLVFGLGACANPAAQVKEDLHALSEATRQGKCHALEGLIEGGAEVKGLDGARALAFGLAVGFLQASGNPLWGVFFKATCGVTSVVAFCFLPFAFLFGREFSRLAVVAGTAGGVGMSAAKQKKLQLQLKITNAMVKIASVTAFFVVVILVVLISYPGATYNEITCLFSMELLFF